MPKNVRCNIEDHRLTDNNRKVEDVTKVTLPSPTHPTTTVKAAGMVADVDVPNIYHYDAMEFAVHHNNGTNCNHLSDPGKHNMEFRAARQNYNVALGQVELESMKVQVECLHKSTDKGDIETDNPYGSTEKYSVLRYQEEIRGEIVTLIDATAGIIRINGVDYSSELSALLD